MRPVNQVAKLLEVLDLKDGNSIAEFVSTLSAENILESSYKGQTVLSSLVEALFPVPEPTSGDGVTESIVNTVVSFSRGLSTLVKSYFPVGPDSEGSAVVPKTGDGDLENPGGGQSGRNSQDFSSSQVVVDIATSIGIIAEKIEERRKLVELKGPEEYAAYLAQVTDYITRRCVSYEVGCSMRMASVANALALQYFSNSGHPAEQLLAMQPLKEFLLGFSRYSLEPSLDMYPVHFALSMSGGANEDRFIEDVVGPLLKGVSREARNVSSAGSGVGKTFPGTRDSKGNTLLGYALSSPYCSAKTVGLVLKSFPDLDADPEGSLSLVELLVNNIPRYGMFCSMLDAYKDYAEERTRVASALQAAMQANGVAELRSATRAKRELQDRMLQPSLEAIRRFDSILGVICGKDRKIDAVRKASFLEERGDNCKLCVMEILARYKEHLDEMRDAASEDCADEDSLLVHSTWHMVCTAAKGQKIGAQAAADEVIGVVLQDKGYIRRLGITAARAKQTEICQAIRTSRTQYQEEKLSDGWVYDAGVSCSINRFFGTACAMGKSAASHFETFSKLSDIVFGAVHEIKEKNKTSEKIATYAVYTLAACVPLLIIVTNVVLLVHHSSALKILLIDTLYAFIALLTLALVFEMEKDQRVVDKSVELMEQDLKTYVKVVYSGRSVDTLFQGGDTFSGGGPEEMSAVSNENGPHFEEERIHAPVPSVRETRKGDPTVARIESWVHAVDVCSGVLQARMSCPVRI